MKRSLLLLLVIAPLLLTACRSITDEYRREEPGGIVTPPDTATHDIWRHAGDLGNQVIVTMATAADGSVFAATAAGLYLSKNQGTAWTKVEPHPGNGDIISMHRHTNGALYAGMNRNGILLSRDTGKTWSSVNTGLRDLVVGTIASTTDGKVLAGTNSGEVYISDAAGQTWSRIQQLSSPVMELMQLGGSGAVFAATLARGIFRFSSDGSNLVQVNQQLPPTTVYTLVNSRGNELLAGTHGGGIFRSTNEGALWHTASTGLKDGIIHVLVLHPRNKIFAGSAAGVYRSSPPGISWEHYSNGLPQLSVYDIVVSQDYILAGTSQGIYRAKPAL